MKTLITMILLSTLVGCATPTKFTGSAHITKKACAVKCQGWDMQMTGMVAMGEYSSACVCSDSGKSAKNSTLINAASVAAGSAGVIKQMQDMAARRNSSGSSSGFTHGTSSGVSGTTMSP